MQDKDSIIFWVKETASIREKFETISAINQQLNEDMLKLREELNTTTTELIRERVLLKEKDRYIEELELTIKKIEYYNALRTLEIDKKIAILREPPVEEQI